jgi:hypothetical protein
MDYVDKASIVVGVLTVLIVFFGFLGRYLRHRNER